MHQSFKSRWVLTAIFLFCIHGVGVGCTRKDSSSTSSSSSFSSGSQSRTVNLAIWSHYVSPQLMGEFEKKTGIKVQVSNYSSNEELLAKLQAGASGYDVVVPSDYMVFVMIKLGLIRELDTTQLTRLKAVDSRFLKKPYDPENKFSIPFDWGTTGIAINRSLYTGSVKSWKDLLGKEDLAGKISLLDDAREVIGAALKIEGHSINTKNPQELQKAKELLLKMRYRVKAFTSEPLMPLVNGEVAVAQAFVSDALHARKMTDGKIDYVIPEEGGTFWIDSLVIPQGAKHLKEAYALIDFLLEGKSSLSAVQNLFLSPTNKETFALLSKEMQNDPRLFPPASVVARCEMIQDLGESLVLWDRIWTEVKAQHE